MVSQYLLTRTNSIWPVVALGLVYVVLSLVCMTALLRRSALHAQAPGLESTSSSNMTDASTLKGVDH